MPNRSRSHQIKFNVTEEEKALIDQKQEESGMSKSAFYRAMILNGSVSSPASRTDIEAIRKLTVEVNRIGNNINQVTHKVNTSGKVTRSDILEIDKKLGEIWQFLKSTLSSQL